MSLNIEDSIISLLDQSDALENAWNLGLKPELFKDPVKSGIVSFIFEYWFSEDRKLAPTREVVEHQFPNYDYVDAKESLEWLVESLQQRYKDIEVRSAIEEIAQAAGEDSDSEKALRIMGAKAYEIVELTTDRKSLSNLVENIQDRRNRYDERSTFKGEVLGVPLGLNEIDQFTFGTTMGEFTVVGASTGIGKSWTLGTSVIAARKAGFTPYLATLELPREDFEDRLDCIYSGVGYGRLIKGRLVPNDKDKLFAAHESLRDLGPIYVDHPPLGERTVQNLINRARQRGADCIFIDQLSFMTSRHERYDRPDLRWAEITDEIKRTLSDIGMAGTVAVQFNRKSKDQARPGLHNFAESGNTERIVDNAFSLYRTNEMKFNNAMEITLLKSRRAELDTTWLLNWEISDHRTEFSVDQIVLPEDQ